MSRKTRIVIKTNKGWRRGANPFPGYAITKSHCVKKKAAPGMATTESSKK